MKISPRTSSGTFWIGEAKRVLVRRQTLGRRYTYYVASQPSNLNFFEGVPIGNVVEGAEMSTS